MTEALSKRVLTVTPVFRTSFSVSRESTGTREGDGTVVGGWDAWRGAIARG